MPNGEYLAYVDARKYWGKWYKNPTEFNLHMKNETKRITQELKNLTSKNLLSRTISKMRKWCKNEIEINWEILPWKYTIKQDKLNKWQDWRLRHSGRNQ